MNKFQNINFRSLGDFYDYLPESEKVVVEVLHDLIKTTLPEVAERLGYNVPFFKKYRNICFIWPAAIPWGNVKSGVQLGFVHGHLLTDEEDYLEAASRKYLRTKTFNSASEIDFSTVRSLLIEAEYIDDVLRTQVKRR